MTPVKSLSDEHKTPALWQSVEGKERITDLDVLRGVALLGVLLANQISDFREPLAAHILDSFGSSTGVDRIVSVVIAALVEFKAFTTLSLLFGVGTSIFAERAAVRGRNPDYFLVRRYLVLFAIGLCHLLLIWNGDILTLYSVCGFLLIPLLRLPTPALTITSLVLIIGSFFINWGFIMPSDATMHQLADGATAVYRHGSFGAVLAFHFHETRVLIVPLLVLSIPRTLGLMALGAACGRIGIFREPDRHKILLWMVASLGILIGGSATGLSVYRASTGNTVPVSPLLLDLLSYVPLTLGIVATALLLLRVPAVRNRTRPFAALGQMALTNYLTQSVILSFLFYGYGLGLFGQIGAGMTMLIGLALYALQLAGSVCWLRYYRFGPVEWLWRSLTYGHRQGFSCIKDPFIR